LTLAIDRSVLEKDLLSLFSPNDSPSARKEGRAGGHSGVGGGLLAVT
jgi:hypothetical protein